MGELRRTAKMVGQIYTMVFVLDSIFRGRSSSVLNTINSSIQFAPIRTSYVSVVANVKEGE